MLLPTPLCTVFALTFIFRKICHVGIVYEDLLFELHLLWVQQLSGVYIDHHSSERTAALLFNQHTIKGETLYFVSQKERAVYHGEGSMAPKHSWSPTEGAKLLLVAWCHLGRSNLYNTQALPHDHHVFRWLHLLNVPPPSMLEDQEFKWLGLFYIPTQQ